MNCSLKKWKEERSPFLQLQEGILSYDSDAILGLLPTIGKALTHTSFHLRTLIQLDQTWLP